MRDKKYGSFFDDEEEEVKHSFTPAEAPRNPIIAACFGLLTFVLGVFFVIAGIAFTAWTMSLIFLFFRFAWAISTGMLDNLTWWIE